MGASTTETAAPRICSPTHTLVTNDEYGSVRAYPQPRVENHWTGRVIDLAPGESVLIRHTAHCPPALDAEGDLRAVGAKSKPIPGGWI